MASTRRDRRDLDLETPETFGTCPACAHADPQARSRHYLEMARRTSLDTLRWHLHEQFVRLRDTEKQRPDVVDDICLWVSTLLEQFNNLADPDTGAPMPWWEARAYMAERKREIAVAAYQRAPVGYRTRMGSLLFPNNIANTVQAVMPRQPGEDRLEDI